MPIATTTFHTGEPFTKIEQESRVATVFISAYEKSAGIVLEPLGSATEPPDRLYRFKEISMGVELFELHQMYDTRAFTERLTNAVYAEFERLYPKDRYLGVSATLTSGRPSMWAERDTIEQWRLRGVVKKQAQQFAREFVELVARHVSTGKDIPHRPSAHVSGINILIDEVKYPAVKAFGSYLSLNHAPEYDPRRSDGRSSPLVILTGAASYTESDYAQRIAEKFQAKALGRKRWPVVNRAILVAHDMPRGHYYEGVGREWEKLLRLALGMTTASVCFDEIWLVTGRQLERDPEVFPIYQTARGN